jgi:hypothetical protein
MDSFSPEFSAYWLREPVEAPEQAEPLNSAEVLSPSQKAALEELVELVSAARSVV